MEDSSLPLLPSPRPTSSSPLFQDRYLCEELGGYPFLFFLSLWITDTLPLLEADVQRQMGGGSQQLPRSSILMRLHLPRRDGDRWQDTGPRNLQCYYTREIGLSHHRATLLLRTDCELSRLPPPSLPFRQFGSSYPLVCSPPPSRLPANL